MRIVYFLVLNWNLIWRSFSNLGSNDEIWVLKNSCIISLMLKMVWGESRVIGIHLPRCLYALFLTRGLRWSSFEMPTMVVAANARKRFVMLLVSHRQPPLSSLEKKQIAREDDNNSHPCDALNLHRRCVFTAKEEIKAVKSWVSASHCQCACAIAENQLGGSWIYDRGHCEGCFMLVCEKINTNPFRYNP